jgi:hypothetical protein
MAGLHALPLALAMGSVEMYTEERGYNMSRISIIDEKSDDSQIRRTVRFVSQLELKRIINLGPGRPDRRGRSRQVVQSTRYTDGDASRHSIGDVEERWPFDWCAR